MNNPTNDLLSNPSNNIINNPSNVPSNQTSSSESSISEGNIEIKLGKKKSKISLKKKKSPPIGNEIKKGFFKKIAEKSQKRLSKFEISTLIKKLKNEVINEKKEKEKTKEIEINLNSFKDENNENETQKSPKKINDEPIVKFSSQTKNPENKKIFKRKFSGNIGECNFEKPEICTLKQKFYQRFSHKNQIDFFKSLKKIVFFFYYKIKLKLKSYLKY